MLKEKLTRAVKEALAACRTEDRIPDVGVHVEIELQGSGYTTNVPLVLARRSENTSTTVQTRASVYAEQIAERINAHPDTPAYAEVAPDGALTLLPTSHAYATSLRSIAVTGAEWGKNNEGVGKRALVEFVSANPNGPITIQHARGASIGDAIASLLEWSGYTVEREFYVNDSASAPQLRNLARAVFAAYRERFGEPVAMESDSDAYSGEYVTELAAKIAVDSSDRYVGLSPEAAVTAFTPLVIAAMRDAQEATLAQFGVRFDRWFSEATLVHSGALQKVMDALLTAGNAYTSGGALWLKTTAFGDDSDRVLLRNDGTPSYFAGDLAYHSDKLQTRAFDLVVDVWNSDHRSYIGRTRAGLVALGIENVADHLHIAVFGPVRILQDGMELRTGRQATGLVTLNEIMSAGDSSALRFALVGATPAPNAIDISMESLASSGSFGAIRAALARTPVLTDTPVSEDALVALSDNASAATLIRYIDALPETVRHAVHTAAPIEIALYAQELAGLLNGGDALSDGNGEALLRGVARQTLVNALAILGIRP